MWPGYETRRLGNESRFGLVWALWCCTSLIPRPFRVGLGMNTSQACNHRLLTHLLVKKGCLIAG